MARYRYRVEAVTVPPEGVVLDRKVLLTFPGEMMGNPDHHVLLCFTEEEIDDGPARDKPADGGDRQRGGSRLADADSPG